MITIFVTVMRTVFVTVMMTRRKMLESELWFWMPWQLTSLTRSSVLTSLGGASVLTSLGEVQVY